MGPILTRISVTNLQLFHKTLKSTLKYCTLHSFERQLHVYKDSIATNWTRNVVGTTNDQLTNLVYKLFCFSQRFISTQYNGETKTNYDWTYKYYCCWVYGRASPSNWMPHAAIKAESNSTVLSLKRLIFLSPTRPVAFFTTFIFATTSKRAKSEWKSITNHRPKPFQRQNCTQIFFYLKQLIRKQMKSHQMNDASCCQPDGDEDWYELGETNGARCL